MAKLKNPQNNLDAIRQDYQDKHASAGGAVLVCRKYDRQVRDKDGKLVFDKAGNPVTFKSWFEAQFLTKDVDKYVYHSEMFSEQRKNDCYCTINSFPADCEPDVKTTKTWQCLSYRSVAKLAHLTGFYLDFDHIGIHALAKKLEKQKKRKNQQDPMKPVQDPAELVEEVLNYADMIVATLESYLPADYGMPIISFTGGGFGFYFPLKPIPSTPENRTRYMEIWEKLYRRYSDIFKGILGTYENDHAVLDYVRVIRITGTYNSKTNTYSQYIARYGNVETNEVYEYSLDEIADLYHLDDLPAEKSNISLVSLSSLQNKKREKREKKETKPEEGSCTSDLAPNISSSMADHENRGNVAYPSKWYQGYANAKQLGRYLALAVKSLEYLDTQGTLQRNNVLFLIACLMTEIEYAKYGCYIFYNRNKVSHGARQDVIDYILLLNDSLENPLEEEELANLLKSALSNQYHFRRLATVQKFLNLTNAEFETLGWLEHQKKEEQKQERNNALTDLDKEVVRLYLAGLSDAKIAKELGIPKLQSIRIRQRLGVTDRSVKWEDVDFEGNKRHLQHKTGHDTPEMRQIAQTRLFNGCELTYGDFLGRPSVELSRYLKSECPQLGKEKIREIYRDFIQKNCEYVYRKNMMLPLENDTNNTCDNGYEKVVSFGDGEIRNAISLWYARKEEIIG